MAKSSQAPRALKAKTTQGLERLMLINNVRRQAFHQYQIIWDGKEWVAWYYEDRSQEENQIAGEILREPTE